MIEQLKSILFDMRTLESTYQTLGVKVPPQLTSSFQNLNKLLAIEMLDYRKKKAAEKKAEDSFVLPM